MQFLTLRHVLGKRIAQVMEAGEVSGSHPEDIMNLMRQAVGLIDHTSNSHKDVSQQKSFELTEAKIRKTRKMDLQEHCRKVETLLAMQA